MTKPPILITGSHRSGTTWVGRILGESHHLKYIHEPFNPSKHPEAPIDAWFQYISKINTDPSIQKRVQLYLWQLHRFSWARFLEDLKKATYFSQLVRFGSTELKGIYGRPLYKDPIAIFSSEWFFELFNAQIVVCIRHPAAFVSSLMNLGWTFNFDELLKQEVLVKEFLEPHLKDILSLQQMEKSLGKPDILKQGILLWNIIYSYVEELRQKYKDHPDWIFIKHEDLSLEPLEKFAEVFQQLEIPYTQKIQKAVSDYTTPNKFNYRAKNSRENITIWKDRLQKEEIELIREKTSPIWNSFYEEKDW